MFLIHIAIKYGKAGGPKHDLLALYIQISCSILMNLNQSDLPYGSKLATRKKMNSGSGSGT